MSDDKFAIAFDLDGKLMDPQPRQSELKAMLDGDPMYPGDLLRLRDVWWGFSTCDETEPSWLTDSERRRFEERRHPKP